MGSPTDLRAYGHDMVEFIAETWENLESYSPAPHVKPGFLLDKLPKEAPKKPEEWASVIEDVKNLFLPGMSHFHNPNFHAYFEGGTSAPSVAGDMLASAVVGPTFNWRSGPASTELEMTVIDWLGRMLNLPEEFLFSSDKSTGGGVIQESITGSTLLVLISAKMRMVREMQKKSPSLDPCDVTPKLIAFTSDQAHSSVIRAGIVAGIRFQELESDENGALRGDTLKAAIHQAKEKGFIPLYVCATLGTTSTCAFDNIKELGPICKRENIWLHIDAAFAGNSFICPEFRPLMDGIEFADSFCCAPQKCLRINLPCCVLWVRDRDAMERTFGDDPPYLRHNFQGQALDFRNWCLYLTRPCRPLKMWFVLRMLGVDALQAHVRKQIRLAHEFEALVKNDNRFELVSEVIVGLVCFRIKGSDELNKQLLDGINSDERVFLYSTEYKGRYVIRYAVCAAKANSSHVTLAWEIILRVAQKLLDRSLEIKG